MPSIQLEDQTIWELLEQLGTSDLTLLEQTIKQLGERGDPQSVPGLKTVSSHYSPTIRVAVVEALRKINCPDREMIFRRALYDSDSRVRLAAAVALGVLDETPIPYDLLSALTSLSWKRRTGALQHLVSRMTEEPELLEYSFVLKTARTALNDRMSPVRLSALQLLSLIETEEAISLIVSALSDPEQDVQNRALRILLQSNHPDTTRLLKEGITQASEVGKGLARRIVALRQIELNVDQPGGISEEVPDPLQQTVNNMTIPLAVVSISVLVLCILVALLLTVGTVAR